MSDTKPLNLVSAAAKVDVTPATIRYWILTGALPAEKVGGQWEINADDLSRVDAEKREIGWGRRGERGKVVPNEVEAAE